MIENGKKVKFHYTLRVNGEVRDTSDGREPLEYVQGAGHIIKGLEAEIANMNVGDKKTVTIPAALGYGEVQAEAKRKLPKEAIKNSDGLKVGDVVGASNGEQHFQAVISEVTDNEVELDFNHPLAGKDLEFDVEIISAE
ncbi:FKBP-type peptidyl-prolyl cis-trans isomerase SlyD [Parelusimicrobium proximum]|uniref:FKBP-type peptidyl-prolyl cis-trans isomerase n=1 Tax=Parelusimicrobium proximum TaxID=3228953 RepID=UPI003D16355C